jgi:Flp pilus assembly protein TadG
MTPAVKQRANGRGVPARILAALGKFLLKDQRGSAMVEFALVAAVIFIPMVFGIIEFGRLTWAKNMITAAAREGVRYSIVHGSSSGAVADSAAVADYVINRTKLSPIIVHPSWTGAKDPGKDTATVRVEYTYTPIVKVPGLLTSKTINSTSKQIIAY